MLAGLIKHRLPESRKDCLLCFFFLPVFSTIGCRKFDTSDCLFVIEFNVPSRRKMCPQCLFQEENVNTTVCVYHQENASTLGIPGWKCVQEIWVCQECIVSMCLQWGNVSAACLTGGKCNLFLSWGKFVQYSPSRMKKYVLITFQVETGSTMCLLWRNCFHYMHTVLRRSCVHSVSVYQKENVSPPCLHRRKMSPQ